MWWGWVARMTLRQFLRPRGQQVLDASWITLADLPDLRETLPDWLASVRQAFREVPTIARPMTVVYAFAALHGMPERPQLPNPTPASIEQISTWLDRVTVDAGPHEIAETVLNAVNPEHLAIFDAQSAGSKTPVAIQRIRPYVPWRFFFSMLFPKIAQPIGEDIFMFAIQHELPDDAEKAGGAREIIVLDTSVDRARERYHRSKRFARGSMSTSPALVISRVMLKSGVSLMPLDWASDIGIAWHEKGLRGRSLPPSYIVFLPSVPIPNPKNKWYASSYQVVSNVRIIRSVEQPPLSAMPGLPSTFVDLPLAEVPTAELHCDSNMMHEFWRQFVRAIHEWQDALDIPNRASVCPPPHNDPAESSVAARRNDETKLPRPDQVGQAVFNSVQAEDFVDLIFRKYHRASQEPALIVVVAPEMLRNIARYPLVWKRLLKNADVVATAQWLHNPQTNPPPNSVGKYVMKCRDTAFRFLVFNVWGIDTAGDGHDNSVIIDRQSKTIEWFEPHGAKPDGEAPEFAFLQHSVLPALGALFPGYALSDAPQVCPAMGPQALEPSDTGGYCVCWSLMFLALRLLNPTWPALRITAQMVRGGTANYQGELVGLKTFYSPHADLAPRFERNPKVLAFIIRSYVARFAAAAEIIASEYQVEKRFEAKSRAENETKRQSEPEAVRPAAPPGILSGGTEWARPRPLRQSRPQQIGLGYHAVPRYFRPSHQGSYPIVPGHFAMPHPASRGTTPGWQRWFRSPPSYVSHPGPFYQHPSLSRSARG